MPMQHLSSTTHARTRTRGGAPPFWIIAEPEGLGFVLSLYGELDLAACPQLERRIKRLQWAGAQRITIDLSGLDFIDSSGLHALLRAHERARADQLLFLRAPRRVHRVFELTETDRLLPFAD